MIEAKEIIKNDINDDLLVSKIRWAITINWELENLLLSEEEIKKDLIAKVLKEFTDMKISELITTYIIDNCEENNFEFKPYNYVAINLVCINENCPGEYIIEEMTKRNSWIMYKQTLDLFNFCVPRLILELYEKNLKTILSVKFISAILRLYPKNDQPTINALFFKVEKNLKINIMRILVKEAEQTCFLPLLKKLFNLFDDKLKACVLDDLQNNFSVSIRKEVVKNTRLKKIEKNLIDEMTKEKTKIESKKVEYKQKLEKEFNKELEDEKKKTKIFENKIEKKYQGILNEKLEDEKKKTKIYEKESEKKYEAILNEKHEEEKEKYEIKVKEIEIKYQVILNEKLEEEKMNNEIKVKEIKFLNQAILNEKLEEEISKNKIKLEGIEFKYQAILKEKFAEEISKNEIKLEESKKKFVKELKEKFANRKREKANENKSNILDNNDQFKEEKQHVINHKKNYQEVEENINTHHRSESINLNKISACNQPKHLTNSNGFDQANN